MKRVICYANLNCFNSPDNVTDEHMQKFFIEALRETPNRPALEVVDVIVDRSAPDIYYKQREGWQRLLKICENDIVDTIVVPAVQMVTKGIVDIVELFRDMRSTYDCDLYFLYEQISSSDKEREMQFQFFAVMEEHKNNLKKAERKLRGHFYDATQINREISAVPVLLDNKLYEKAERVARDYGCDAQSLIHYFIEEVSKEQNRKLFEKMMGWEDVE
ncbi:MAG: recombinase family protein [Oscillospiraceae bacterium]|nr:recombinase family protein [Oscillospiraceae bacterium]